MFTGIVERTGTVAQFAAHDLGAKLTLGVGESLACELSAGESLAVNGCCLTVLPRQNGDAADTVSFDILQQTLDVTNLGDLAAGRLVNLERALRVGDRLSGHIVQGHVDGTSEVRAYEEAGDDHRLEMGIPEAFARYLIPKGSITIDGMSLTVAELDDTNASATIWITPHTHAVTNLRETTAGKRVNLEFDVIAKYVERLQG